MRSPLRSIVALAAVLAAGCSGGSSSRSAPPPAAAASAASASSAPAPLPAGALARHPVVLVHGAAGFRSIGPVDYFHQVPDHLRGLGVEVLVTRTAAVHTIDHRANELRDQILAAYPDPSVKLNLIAHSMGGVDARAMITHLGMADRVASLSTISTPHRGTVLADAASGLLPLWVQQSTDVLLNVIGFDYNQVSDLTTRHMRGTFNPATPDDPRVFYQSWAGDAAPGGALSPLLFASWAVVEHHEGANDGIVSVDSARWGLFRGTLRADHMDEVGHLVGLAPAFDHLRFYEDLVRDLGQRGF